MVLLCELSLAKSSDKIGEKVPGSLSNSCVMNYKPDSFVMTGACVYVEICIFNLSFMFCMPSS